MSQPDADSTVFSQGPPTTIQLFSAKIATGDNSMMDSTWARVPSLAHVFKMHANQINKATPTRASGSKHEPWGQHKPNTCENNFCQMDVKIMCETLVKKSAAPGDGP